MFIPVRRNLFRWGTPDPEGDWIMHGFLISSEDAIILIDPPLVPDLMKTIQRLGKPEAIILTTLDHTRGSKYISKKTGARLLIPDQGASDAFDPDTILKQKEINVFEKYGNAEIYGLHPIRITVGGRTGNNFPWLDEFALLTKNNEIITGDIAIGTPDGKIMLAPEWFPHDPPHERYQPAEIAFTKVVKETGANSLLATHGENIYGNLQELRLKSPLTEGEKI